MKRLVDKLVEGMLKMSGAVTSITVLLIILFLFKEGAGLFSSSTIEKGYTLLVNSQNPIEELSPETMKKVFDGQIENWKDLGAKNEQIRIFRFDEIFSIYSDEELGADFALLPQKIAEVIASDATIIAYIPQKYVPKDYSSVKELKHRNISWSDYFLGKEWLPTATPAPLFGILPLLLGTLLVSIIAILIAIPLGVGVAIYLAEIANERTRKILKPAIELLAGIPSVVYGFFGLVVLVPIVQKMGGLALGETAFTGSLILAVMALPTIISIAEDSMRNTPKAMRDASLALGATQWQTIYRVVLPYASSGISAAIVLGIGRAIGETMAVLMVTGNAAVIPNSMFESVRTIPATIAAELGEAPGGGTHYQSLFLLGCVLFIITLIISILTEAIASRKVIKE